ncbi:hypothetical protein D9758_008108 [Tetrapyrgos nigripes]|uniref:Uncharacterized protein n=1 Tax=Tetrapyrgos nigripes TaxID=182062 RepID=A0A8H5GHI2_9AGAR|nr:hypothetical protein D9758_008108 [Tetrapyrgos nigripes]
MALKDVHSAPERTERTVEFDDVQSILACRKMSHFHFNHPFRVILSDRDMEDIAMAWPELAELELCPRSLFEDYREEKLTMFSVFHLTRHCLKLQKLALCFDTRLSETPPLPLPLTSKHADLKILDVGESKLVTEDAPGIANLLGQLCSADCGLNFTSDQTSVYDFHEELKPVWYVVVKTFPLFSRVYRTHGGANQQNEDLRHELELITGAMDLEKFRDSVQYRDEVEYN